MVKKQPLQIYLDEGMLRALRDVADKQKTSMAEIVRESVARYLLSLPVEEDPALGIIGLSKSGVTDAAENHDKYLMEHLEAKLCGHPECEGCSREERQGGGRG